MISSSPREDGREPADHLEDVRRVAVEPDDRVVRRRRRIAEVDDAGLLDHVDHAPVVAVDDDAEALRIRDLLHEHRGPVVSVDEGANRGRLRVLEDVVAEADDQIVGTGEALGHADDLRDPAGLDLHLVGEIRARTAASTAPRSLHPPVSEQVDQLAGMALAGDDHHLADACELQQLQRVVDHRPAADRQQMLVDDARQLAQPRRLAAGRDQSLCLHAGADATAGRSKRRAGQQPERQLDRRADPEREDDRPDPDRAAESEADRRAQRPRSPSARRRSARRACWSDEHQRVSRARAHRRSDVERGADAEEGERNATRRIRTPSPSSDNDVTGWSAQSAGSRTWPTSSAFSSVPSPTCARSAQDQPSTSTETTTLATPKEIPNCSASPWCSTSHGGRPSSDSRKPTIPRRRGRARARARRAARRGRRGGWGEPASLGT